MTVKHAILGILAPAPRHGYDLKRAFDEKLGDFWSVNVGQIYTTLDRLQAEGLVQNISDGDDGDRKMYAITEAGRLEFDDWRTRALKAEPRVLRDELFLRVLFMEDTEVEAVTSLIHTQKNVYMGQMMHLTNRKIQIEQATRRMLAKAPTPETRKQALRDRLVASILLDAALYHAEADIRWLEHCEARLKDIANIDPEREVRD